MAGDWLKIEKDTPEKPEVLAIASTLSTTPDEAFGLCFRFWRWCDSQLVDGNARSVTPSVIDSLVGRHGFADALLSVGWLLARNGSLVVPNFDRHMSQTAKQRALTAKRAAQFRRTNRNAAVTHGALPREEKRREEKSIKETPLPPALDTEDFRDAWTAWLAYRTELKKPLSGQTKAAQLKMLDERGRARAIATIRHTIAMGWQGLREPEPSPAKTQMALPTKGLADDLD